MSARAVSCILPRLRGRWPGGPEGGNYRCSVRFLVLSFACHKVQRTRQGDLLRRLAVLGLDPR